MGMAVGGKKGGPQSSINITPLVDVVLVLLIIFIVVSPGDATFVPNPVPKPPEKDESTVLATEQLVIELLADGTVLFNHNPTTRKDFPQEFRDAIASRSDRKLFVAVEDEVPYEVVMDWFSLGRTLGATVVALQLKPPELTKSQ